MLLDKIMPTYHFNEVHATVVQASTDRIFRVIKETRATDIPLFNTLFWIRSVLGRLTGRGGRYFSNDSSLLDQALKLGFVVLAETDQEIVFGAIAEWWRLWGAKFYQIAGIEDFLTFDRPGYAIVAANFCVDCSSSTSVAKVSTETRIYAPDPTARKEFAIYWRMIYPGSALIRRMWLRSIKRRAERG